MAHVIEITVEQNEYGQTCGVKDEPSTFEKAEKVAGFKLDKRRNYAIIQNEVRQLAKWTQPCSGCSDDSEYSNASRGSGCSECGYHGVVRTGMYLPLSAKH